MSMKVMKWQNLISIGVSYTISFETKKINFNTAITIKSAEKLKFFAKPSPEKLDFVRNNCN